MCEALPEFLNEALYEETLEYALYQPQHVKITNTEHDLASKSGDNYLGKIYRVKIAYDQLADKDLNVVGKTGQTLNVIVKIISDSDANAFLHVMNVFLKEKIMYRDLLPRLELIYPGNEKFGPRMYHSLRQPLGTLIFEDLNASNYRIASRNDGLDLAHCELVLRKLAKFHASSMQLWKRDPTQFHCFKHGVLSTAMLKPTLLPLRFYSASLAVCEATVRSWPGYERIADKLTKYLANFVPNALASVSVREDDFNVLNHGDMWTNNILFAYGNGEQAPPTDATFIDFQMTVRGSLGMDINYFLSTSVQVNLLRTHTNHLLQVYQRALREALELIGYDGAVPTYEQVVAQVQQRQVFGLFAAFTILPLISTDQDTAADNTVDNLNDEQFALMKLQKTFAVPRVQAVLKERLRQFDESGALDSFL